MAGPTENTATLRQLDEATHSAESLRPVIESLGGDLALEAVLTRIIAGAVALSSADSGSPGLVAKEHSARSATINRIGQLITSRLSLDELLQTAVEAIQTQLGYSNVALLLVDQDDRQMLVLRACSGIFTQNKPGEYRQRVDSGIIGAAAQARKHLLIEDVWNDPRYIPIPDVREVCAELAVPVVVGDELQGVLNIETDGSITAEEAQSVQSIADQLGIAIENARLFVQTRHAFDETRLLYETSQRISTAMSVEEVVAAYLEQVAAHGQYQTDIVPYETDNDGRIISAATHGFWSPEVGLHVVVIPRLHARESFSGELDAGRVVALADVRTDPRISDAIRAAMASTSSIGLALIPLMADGRRIGVVTLTSALAHEWSEADLQPYQITGALLAAAIHTRQQHHLLEEHRQRLAVLEERRRLARELHDSTTQSLASISLLAQALPDLWNSDRAQACSGLHQIGELARGALVEMRALLHELRPAELHDRQLANAIQQHVAAFEQRTRIPVAFNVTGELALPDQVERTLFRITQEALANVARHARAHHVHVALYGGDDPPKDR